MNDLTIRCCHKNYFGNLNVATENRRWRRIIISDKRLVLACCITYNYIIIMIWLEPLFLRFKIVQIPFQILLIPFFSVSDLKNSFSDIKKSV